MKLLIDGDTIAYGCAYATKKIYSLGLVKKIMTNKLQTICDTWNTYDYDILLTDTDREANFRHKLATIKPYKGTRKTEKPKWLPSIRKYLVSTHGAEIVSGKEADDEMGARQTDDTMIVTIDKDLMMIPGRHYNYVTDRVVVAYDPGQLSLVSKRNSKGVLTHKLTGVGFKWFCAQCLLGDAVDNIPGLNGYGPVAVHGLLHNVWNEEQMWQVVIKEFKKKDVLVQLNEIAELLWIERKPGNNWRFCWCRTEVDVSY